MALFLFFISFLFGVTNQLLQVSQSQPEISLIQQVSNKMNVTYQIEGIGFKYLTIEMKIVLSENSFIALIYNENSPFIVQDNNTNFTTMDYDGFVNNKSSHFLSIKNSNFDKYISIISNNTFTFDLILSGTLEQKCLNDCSQNGICIQGYCKCYQTFIGKDCSIEAKLLIIGKIEILKMQQDVNYVYFEQQEKSKLLELIIETKSNETIHVYELIQDEVFLPTHGFNDYNGKINKTSKYLQHIKIKGYKDVESDESEQEDDDDSEDSTDSEESENGLIDINIINEPIIPNRLIIALVKIQNKPETNLKISLNHYSSQNQKISDSMLIIIITVSVVVGLIIIIPLLCYLYKKIKQNQKQETKDKPQIELQVFKQSNQTDNQQICVICRELLININQNQVYLNINHIQKLKNCGHSFHEQCLQQWLTQKNVCPICKAKV